MYKHLKKKSNETSLQKVAVILNKYRVYAQHKSKLFFISKHFTNFLALKILQ